jgi:Domain of unknown function (DUF4268)
MQYQRYWSELIERARGKIFAVEDARPLSQSWLKGKSGREGFLMNFVLNQQEARVECFIKPGLREQNLQAFNALEERRGQIEKDFGNGLVWQKELPHSEGCRIYTVLNGGWKTHGLEWPVLQERMIEAMKRLENALRKPIHNLKLS